MRGEVSDGGIGRQKPRVEEQHARSSRASETRSRSFESTTKMMPWVFWKSAGRTRACPERRSQSSCTL
jgi:hypothetical protein